MRNTSAFTSPKRSALSHTVQDEKTPSHNDNRHLYFHCHLFIGGGGGLSNLISWSPESHTLHASSACLEQATASYCDGDREKKAYRTWHGLLSVEYTWLSTGNGI